MASSFEFSRFSVNGANERTGTSSFLRSLFINITLKHGSTVCRTHKQTHLPCNNINKQIRINLTNKIYITLYVSTLDSFESPVLCWCLEMWIGFHLRLLDWHAFAITIYRVYIVLRSYCLSQPIKYRTVTNFALMASTLSARRKTFCIIFFSADQGSIEHRHKCVLCDAQNERNLFLQRYFLSKISC